MDDFSLSRSALRRILLIEANTILGLINLDHSQCGGHQWNL